MAGRIAMDELDLVGNTQLHSAERRLFAEQLAHVDARADDAVIARPGAEHFPRAAAEIEHSIARLQPQRCAERSELLGRDRIVDAVSALGDVEDPWDIHECSFLGGRDDGLPVQCIRSVVRRTQRCTCAHARPLGKARDVGDAARNPGVRA